MWINDFFRLIYPRVCLVCGNSLIQQESVICTSCEFRLPRTWYHQERDNPVSAMFWGRVPLYSASAFLHFNKGNAVQQLIHELKYKGHQDVGRFLGARYGLMLAQSPFFREAELIIPVPLHPKKQQVRGFNQSRLFAEGLAKSLNASCCPDVLSRIRSTETQTRKGRFSRWRNVSDSFLLRFPEKIRGKHLLLVDDVITTGATLEACAQVLMQGNPCRLSIAAIAVAAV